jgi:hypothetical protein
MQVEKVAQRSMYVCFQVIGLQYPIKSELILLRPSMRQF